jgi:hypothetical protein
MSSKAQSRFTPLSFGLRFLFEFAEPLHWL